jgi:hypothetical protein
LRKYGRCGDAAGRIARRYEDPRAISHDYVFRCHLRNYILLRLIE